MTTTIGLGTNGVASNVTRSGLKVLMEGLLCWIFCMWCLAHRLELAVEDALKGTCLDLVHEMTLRLYYLYDKSSTKCRQLEDIISTLKECLCFDDPGIGPVPASGSRWLAHKLNAMKRVLSKYGAYTGYLAALSEYSSVKSADRAKIHVSSYYKKWVDAKDILGCTVFVDLLTPCTIFSKCMQYDEVDILGAQTFC